MLGGLSNATELLLHRSQPGHGLADCSQRPNGCNQSSSSHPYPSGPRFPNSAIHTPPAGFYFLYYPLLNFVLKFTHFSFLNICIIREIYLLYSRFWIHSWIWPLIILMCSCTYGLHMKHLVMQMAEGPGRSSMRLCWLLLAQHCPAQATCVIPCTPGAALTMFRNFCSNACYLHLLS